MLTALEKAKAGGTKIISINPLPEAGLERFKNPQTPRGLAGGGTALTDLFLQVRLGGDQALFRALNRLVLDTEEPSTRTSSVNTPTASRSSRARPAPTTTGTRRCAPPA